VVDAAILILAFPSTHMALRAERAAKQEGLAARMIPAPRHLSTDCHMALELRQPDLDVAAFLSRHRIDARIHRSG
jgi:hypothetical protein